MTAKEYYSTRFKADFRNFWTKALRGPGYIKFASFFQDHGYDALEDIDRDNIVYFLSTLGHMIILDKAMYRNFPAAYPQYQKATGYPRLDIGWSRENPWIMLGAAVRTERRITLAETQEKFAEFSDFFIKDLEQYFTQQFKFVAWADVKNAMLEEIGESQSEYGRIFSQKITSLA